MNAPVFLPTWEAPLTHGRPMLKFLGWRPVEVLGSMLGRALFNVRVELAEGVSPGAQLSSSAKPTDMGAPRVLVVLSTAGLDCRRSLAPVFG